MGEEQLMVMQQAVEKFQILMGWLRVHYLQDKSQTLAALIRML